VISCKGRFTLHLASLPPEAPWLARHLGSGKKHRFEVRPLRKRRQRPFVPLGGTAAAPPACKERQSAYYGNQYEDRGNKVHGCGGWGTGVPRGAPDGTGSSGPLSRWVGAAGSV